MAQIHKEIADFDGHRPPLQAKAAGGRTLFPFSLSAQSA
jgi:hypothetical protein